MENPIAQSYVDIILRGCLTISKDFAKEFILTTQGWLLLNGKLVPTTDGIAGHGDQETLSGDHDQIQVHWVNDRHDPLYVRADMDYSRASGHIVDELLQNHLPVALKRRRQYYGRSVTG